MTFFSTIARRDRRGPVDDLLLLRDIEDGAEAATTAETGVAFNATAQNGYKAVASISSVSGTTDGSNYWTLSVEVSDAIGGTYTEVGSYQATGADEQVEIPLSGSYVEALDADAAWVRVTATKTGTTATDITYGAWLSC